MPFVPSFYGSLALEAFLKTLVGNSLQITCSQNPRARFGVVDYPSETAMHTPMPLPDSLYKARLLPGLGCSPMQYLGLS